MDFDMAQIRQPLAIALCVSPIALLTGPVNGYLNRIPMIDLWQVSS